MAVTLSAISADQLSNTSLAYMPEVADGNYRKLSTLDRYDRAKIKPQQGGNLMLQKVEFGAHSSPTELTGLGYDTIGLTTQTTGFLAQYSWHAVVWPALISVLEEEENAGPEKIHDIAKDRTENVMGEAMRRKEQHILFGGQTGYSGLLTWNGVDVATGVFEANVPASQTHSFGGLARSTFATFPGWSHLYGTASSSYSANGEATVRALFTSSRQRLHSVDFIQGSNPFANNHGRALFGHEMFAKDEVSGRMVSQFQGVDVETSEYMPGIGGGGSTTTTAGNEISAYGVSLKGIPLVYLGRNKMRFLGWKDVPDRPVKIALWIDISQICPFYMGSSFMVQAADTY